MQTISTATPLLRWDGARRRWWWADAASGQLYGWQGGAQQDGTQQDGTQQSGAPLAAQVAAQAYAASGGRGRLPPDVVGVRLQDTVTLLEVCRSGGLLLGMGKRLVLLDPAGVAPDGTLRSVPLQVLSTIDAAEPRTVISVGCLDAVGQLVFGTTNTAPERRPIGSFYQYSAQRGVRRLALPAVAAAASLAVSADGTRLYFADAAHGTLMECRYDAVTARVSDHRYCTDGAPPPEARYFDDTHQPR